MNCDLDLLRVVIALTGVFFGGVAFGVIITITLRERDKRDKEPHKEEESNG